MTAVEASDSSVARAMPKSSTRSPPPDTSRLAGFDVAVDDATLVRDRQRGEQLVGEAEDLVQREAPARGLAALLERLALGYLHDRRWRLCPRLRRACGRARGVPDAVGEGGLAQKALRPADPRRATVQHLDGRDLAVRACTPRRPQPCP